MYTRGIMASYRAAIPPRNHRLPSRNFCVPPRIDPRFPPRQRRARLLQCILLNTTEEHYPMQINSAAMHQSMFTRPSHAAANLKQHTTTAAPDLGATSVQARDFSRAPAARTIAQTAARGKMADVPLGHLVRAAAGRPSIAPHKPAETPTADPLPSAPPQGNSPVAAAHDPCDPMTLQAMLDEMFAVWGQNDPQYDLNGDGTVDVLDMLILFSKFAQQQQPEE